MSPEIGCFGLAACHPEWLPQVAIPNFGYGHQQLRNPAGWEGGTEPDGVAHEQIFTFGADLVPTPDLLS
ncbi:MAG: hypothetical protein OSA98_00530 [Rubripirellula sp.]|nr:hypothetical protein [Rubripirellula sp.]